MIQLIALIIFVISLGGVIFIFARKIPALLKLPQTGSVGIREHKYILHFEERIKKILVSFEKQIILHKSLSFAKVLVLKAEIKIDYLLHKIRREAKEKKEKDLKG
jgi:hypothetical protein